MAVADDVREVVALLQFFSQVRVLVEQALPFGLDELPQTNGLREHGGHHLEQAQVVLVVAVLVEGEVHVEGAQRFASAGYRDAQEAGVRAPAAASGAVQEARLVADLGNHHGASRLHDLAGDAFTGGPGRTLPRRADALRGHHLQAVGVGALQHDRSLQHAPAPGEYLQRLLQAGADVLRIDECGVDVGQQRQRIGFG